MSKEVILETREVILTDCLTKLKLNNCKLKAILRKFDEEALLSPDDKEIIREFISLETHELDSLITQITHIED